MELTYQQNLFVEFYLGVANGNGSKAARLAGYKHPEVAASKLLRLVKVQAKVEARVASAAMAANEVLARLSEHAAADLGDFFTIDGEGNPRIDLTRAKKARRTRVVKKLKTKTKTFTSDDGVEVEVQTEIELHNPQFALDKLAQYHQLYQDGPKVADADRPRPRIAIPGSPQGGPGGPPAPRGPRKRKPAG